MGRDLRVHFKFPLAEHVIDMLGYTHRDVFTDEHIFLKSQEALEQLASIDLNELCHEAKVEHCRATRDLSSCGRNVQHVLMSCGHASLCAECSQRCDVCPICRSSIPKSGSRLRPRLYNKCIEAGLISKRHDDRFQEKEHLMADVQRLYSLFDVALENNLVSLVCHYVTDVCLDESAVSSDPVLAFLLDEVVVKDWCKQKFKNIVADLRGIYDLRTKEMEAKLGLILKFNLQLTGVSNVLEVLESSFAETLATQFLDLHHLSENILKAKQHLEVMTWCIRHQFLENVESRYPDFNSWKMQVHERKLAMLQQTWPDFKNKSTEAVEQIGSTLFIEDALSNLAIEQGYSEEMGKDLEVSCLHKDGDGMSEFQSNIEGASSLYPFDKLRAATDILFLHGSSDMVVAKHAIFLYYLFDRYWTLPDVKWRHIVDDFAASFGITRHLVLESLVFYLLDDHTHQALQEAIRLLPEIAGPRTHPKIAQVLLERQSPDAALTVLRCSGRDGFSAYANSDNEGIQLVSLGEAVTAIRVRVECGLLSEAFMYQRMHCFKVREDKSKHQTHLAFSNSLKNGHDSWIYQTEILVTEICSLCMRRNLVDRMIELPWNSEEEKYIHRCLFDQACENPSATHGSLLTVFYIQRYRYVEAYQVDRKLRSLEQSFSESSSAEVAFRIKSISQWRKGLIDKCIDLLPEVQQRMLAKTGDMVDIALFSSNDVEMPSSACFSDREPPFSSTFQASTPVKSPHVLGKNLTPFILNKASPDKKNSLSSPISTHDLEFSNTRAPLTHHGRLLTSTGSPYTSYRSNSSVHGIYSPNAQHGNNWASINILNRGVRQHNGVADPTSYPVGSQSALLKESNKSSSQVAQNDPQFLVEINPFGIEPDDSTGHEGNAYPSMNKIVIEDDNDQINHPHMNGLLENTVHHQNLSTRRKQNNADRPWQTTSLDEANMDSTWRRDSPVEDLNVRGGPRWRSDESSEDEAEVGTGRYTGGNSSYSTRRNRYRRK